MYKIEFGERKQYIELSEDLFNIFNDYIKYLDRHNIKITKIEDDILIRSIKLLWDDLSSHDLYNEIMNTPKYEAIGYIMDYKRIYKYLAKQLMDYSHILNNYRDERFYDKVIFNGEYNFKLPDPIVSLSTIKEHSSYNIDLSEKAYIRLSNTKYLPDIMQLNDNNIKIMELIETKMDDKLLQKDQVPLVMNIAQSFSHFHIILNKLYKNQNEWFNQLVNYIDWNMLFMIIRSFENFETDYHSRCSDYTRYMIPYENILLFKEKIILYYGKEDSVSVISPKKRCQKIENILSDHQIRQKLIYYLGNHMYDCLNKSYNKKSYLNYLNSKNPNIDQLRKFVEDNNDNNNMDFMDAINKFKEERKIKYEKNMPESIKMYIIGSTLTKLICDTDSKFNSEYSESDVDIAVYLDDNNKFVFTMENIIFPRIIGKYKNRYETKKISMTHGYFKFHLIDKNRSNITYEFFNTKKDPYNLVTSFHVPFVRLLYDINNRRLYCCPSFVFSMIVTDGIANSLRWFTCSKKPIDTIYKYFKRGFSFTFNDKDMITFTKYLDDKKEKYKIDKVINTVEHFTKIRQLDSKINKDMFIPKCHQDIFTPSNNKCPIINLSAYIKK